MNDIRFNVSGSFEDLGWKSSYASNFDIRKDEWVKRFGDVRSEWQLMGETGDEHLYRIMDSPMGVYYNLVRKNPVCSRGGVIQLSLFVPAGKRVTSDSILNVKLVLEVMAHFFDGDNKKIISFFESNDEVKQEFIKSIQKQVDNLKTENEPQIYGRLPFDKQSPKLAYWICSDDTVIRDIFSNPHQNALATYLSVWLMPSNVKMDNAVLIDKIQRLYTVQNNKDEYLLLEGNSFDLPLTSQPNMNPKTWKIVADGKSTDVYMVSGGRIAVDECKIEFTRPFSVRFNIPFDDKPLNNKGQNAQKIKNKKKGRGTKKQTTPKQEVSAIQSSETIADINVGDFIVNVEGVPRENVKIVAGSNFLDVSFVATLKTRKVSIESKDFKGALEIDPSKNDNASCMLERLRRKISIIFLDGGEPALIDPGNVTLHADGEKLLVMDAVDKGRFEAIVDMKKSYRLDLKSQTYIWEQQTQVSAKDVEKTINLQRKAITVYIDIPTGRKHMESIKFEAETKVVSVFDKKINGYPLQASDNTLSMRVIQPVWRIIAIASSVLALLLLVFTILFAVKMGLCKNELNELKGKMYESTSLVTTETTSTMEESSAIVMGDTVINKLDTISQ